MNTLIIRSSSIQHLALVIKSLKRQFPESEVDVLTHKHSVESVEAMGGIDAVLPYPSTKDFSPFAFPGPMDKNYDVIVVPTSNMNGFGYENVLLLASRFPKSQVYLCNQNGELTHFPLKKILIRLLIMVTSIPVGILVACFVTLFNLGWLFVSKPKP